MIVLNEVYFSKEDVKYTTRKIVVNMNSVLFMRQNKLRASAPTQVAHLIFRDKIPEECYKEVDSTEVTILNLGNEELYVKETIEEIMQLLKED